MTKSILILMVVLYAMAFLAACGKEVCTASIAPSESKTFGTLEEAKCPAGEVITSIHPNFLAGGVITSIVVACGKVVQTCGVTK